MIRGLQAGNGTSIAHELPGLLELGVQAVRLDSVDLGADEAASRVREALEVGMGALPIVHRVDQLEAFAPGTWVEWHNEPDLGRRDSLPRRDPIDPEVYRASIDQAWAVAEARGLRLFAGCPSNLHRHERGRGLAWLEATRPATWPAGVCVSFHRYPTGDSVWTPHQGYQGRDEEMAALRALTGERPVICSEFGCHTTDRRRSFERRIGFPPRRWSDDDVAAFVADEWAFFEAHGVELAVLYQFIDGPTSTTSAPDRLDTYGIRRLDGTLKPVAFTFREGAEIR